MERFNWWNRDKICNRPRGLSPTQRVKSGVANLPWVLQEEVLARLRLLVAKSPGISQFLGKDIFFFFLGLCGHEYKICSHANFLVIMVSNDAAIYAMHLRTLVRGICLILGGFGLCFRV